jgi:hypothetical protein
MGRSPFRRLNGTVMRKRYWWKIDYLSYTEVGGKLIKKRTQVNLTPVLPEHACMLLPPVDVQEKQREYMDRVNAANREVLKSLLVGETDQLVDLIVAETRAEITAQKAQLRPRLLHRRSRASTIQ